MAEVERWLCLADGIKIYQAGGRALEDKLGIGEIAVAEAKFQRLRSFSISFNLL